jgi:hypothetical protein
LFASVGNFLIYYAAKPFKCHILGLLDWLCKTTIKRKFHISQKWKLLFPHLFRQKMLFHFRFHFHFRQRIFVSISVLQIFVSVSICPFRFRFSAKKSESFCSTFIPNIVRKYSSCPEERKNSAVWLIFFQPQLFI